MVTRLNNWLADKLSNWLSTMAMFYTITFLVLLPLHWQKPSGLVAWVQYSISVFFQGVALPVLAFVSKKAGDRQEKLLMETHDAVIEELDIIKRTLRLASEERDDLVNLIKNIEECVNRQNIKAEKQNNLETPE